MWKCLLISCAMVSLSENTADTKMPLFPGKNLLKIIPEFLGQSQTTPTPFPGYLRTLRPGLSSIPTLESREILSTSVETPSLETFSTHGGPEWSGPMHPVLHAGLPRGLAVTPLPLEGGDHQLVFNVSWLPSLGLPARDYSLEVVSETDTEDCNSPICYEYDIRGDSLWHLVPTIFNPVAQTCVIRPGCAYLVRLIAHPWDGHSSANLQVQLDECTAGVCSCAHAPRLPAPRVQAQTVSLGGEIMANVSWTLPPPRFPLRLPPHLQKQHYFVSIGKQMVSDAHPYPWFAHTITRQVNAEGAVATGDGPRWMLLPIVERSVERSGEREPERSVKPRTIVLDVRLLARVNLVDERGCVGPAGNATAYDPVEAQRAQLGTYALWALLGGACVVAMAAILAVSARAVKRILNALRPAAVSAPPEPLGCRPAWFPLQLRTPPIYYVLIDRDLGQSPRRWVYSQEQLNLDSEVQISPLSQRLKVP